jgi:hypothetical protein|uniref:protein-serine/threonine phosphatase n=1 Tax=Zea mays TaxID=4577 RepID=A0A804MUQ4_MAIZE
MFLTWKPRINTTSRRRSCWRRSSMTRRTLATASSTSERSPTWPHAPLWMTSFGGRRLDAIQSGCTTLSIVKQGDLMVVTNVDDSRVVLGTTSDDGAISTVQLIVHLKHNLPRKSLLTGHEFLCAGTMAVADVV